MKDEKDEATQLQTSEEGKTKRTLKFKGLNDKQKSLLAFSAAGLGALAPAAVIVALMKWVSNEDCNDTNPISHYLKLRPLNKLAIQDGNPIDNTNDPEEITEVIVPSDAPFSDAINDKMTFDEAFTVARNEMGGGGFFEWNGSTYNTYYKEEWENLGEDKRSDFYATIDENYSAEQIQDLEVINTILVGEEDSLVQVEIYETDDNIVEGYESQYYNTPSDDIMVESSDAYAHNDEMFDDRDSDIENDIQEYEEYDQ